MVSSQTHVGHPRATNAAHKSAALGDLDLGFGARPQNQRRESHNTIDAGGCAMGPDVTEEDGSAIVPLRSVLRAAISVDVV
jgi:hypothetical protein